MEPEQSNPLHKKLPGGGSTPAYWEVSQDGDLSLGALGLHTYLMSLPDKWDINSERIARARKEGRDTIRKWMRELETKGLIALRSKNSYTIHPFSGGAK